MPVRGEFLGHIVIDLDADIGAVNLEGPPAGLPEQRIGPAAVAEGGVGEERFRRGFSWSLIACSANWSQVIGTSMLVLLEQILPIEHGDRAAVPRHAEELAAGAGLIEGPRRELVPHRVGAERPEVRESVDLAEASDELELHMHNVRQAASRLERRAQLRVVRVALAGVDQLHLDARVRLQEEIDLFLEVRQPCPDRQRDRFLRERGARRAARWRRGRRRPL